LRIVGILNLEARDIFPGPVAIATIPIVQKVAALSIEVMLSKKLKLGYKIKM